MHFLYLAIYSIAPSAIWFNAQIHNENTFEALMVPNFINIRNFIQMWRILPPKFSSHGKKIQISPLFLYFLPRIFLTVWSNCCGRIQANLHRAFKYNSSQLHHLRRDSFSWQFYPSEIKDKLCTIIPLWLCTYFPFILCIGIAGPFSVFFPPSIFVLSSVYIWLWRKQFSQQLLYKQSKINIYSVTQIGRTKEEQKKKSPSAHKHR